MGESPMTDPETLAALLCETAPRDEGHSWYLTGRPAGPCTAHRSQAARLTGRVYVGMRGVCDPSPPDVVTLAENFLADEKIWPLGANQKTQRCVRGFAAWLRGELESPV